MEPSCNRLSIPSGRSSKRYKSTGARQSPFTSGCLCLPILWRLASTAVGIFFYVKPTESSIRCLRQSGLVHCFVLPITEDVSLLGTNAQIQTGKPLAIDVRSGDAQGSIMTCFVRSGPAAVTRQPQRR